MPEAGVHAANARAWYGAGPVRFIQADWFIEHERHNTKFGEGLPLTPTLSRRERGFAPFALREKGRG